MPHRTWLLLCLPLALSLPGCTPPPSTSLDEDFAAAAAEFDVPRDLLVAIAWSQTRFDDPSEGDHEHGGIRGSGIMDIGAGSPVEGPDLVRASNRLGVDIEDAHDRATNIRMAAAELRWQADRLEAETGVPIERIDDWVGVVGWYGGNEDGGAKRSYARQVYRWIEGGLRAQDPEDSSTWIVIRGQELDLPSLELETVGFSTADSSLADNVVAASSCNYSNGSRTSSSIDEIVVHTAQGSYSGTYNWFQDCDASASAHYVVRSSDGEITQMVAEEDTAWHAGHSDTNSRSVSIEMEGYIEDPGRWYTDAAMDAVARLIVDIANRQGVSLDRSHVIGHMEVPGCSYSGGGGRNCHADPGTGFDWDDLMDRVAAASGSGSSGSGSSGSSGSGSSGSGSSGSGSSGSGSSGSGSSSGVGDLVGFVREGSIYNTDSAVVGASVSTSTGQSATTDYRGYFTVEDVPAGTVTLTVSASGFATATDSADVASGIQNWNSVAVSASSSSSGVPTPSSPTGWTTVPGPEVNLSWTSVSGASSYEVQLWYKDGSDWNDYYTWSTSSTSKTVWPVVTDTDYAWSVRAVTSAGRSEWSSPAYFSFEG